MSWWETTEDDLIDREAQDIDDAIERNSSYGTQDRETGITHGKDW